ncbi:MAG: hypothetical protein H6742_12440 [Alphaproteobacteria bacterium]|nr:hypothetical protein [Alphaproteobacteria bacterium]
MALFAAAPAHAWVLDLEHEGASAGRTAEGLEIRAHPVPTRVLADRESLRLLGPRGGVVRAQGIACQVSLGTGSGVLSSSYDACEDLYDIAPQSLGGTGHADLQLQAPPGRPVAIRLQLTDAPAGGQVLVADDGAVFLDGQDDLFPQASFWTDGRWWPATVDPRSRQLTAETDAGRAALRAWLESPAGALIIRTEETGTRLESEWRLTVDAVPALQSSHVLVPESIDSWCQPDAGEHVARTLLVCLDTESAELKTRRYDRDGRVAEVGERHLPSDHALELVVRHPAWVSVATRLETLSSRQGSPPWAMAETSAPTGEEALVAATRRITRRRYAPRPHGLLRLEVTADGAVVADEELTVLPRYVGALRLGLGAATPADGRYELGPADANGFAEITRASGLVEGEVVVGWATFLDPGGRDYLEPEPVRWAPYVGLGVIGADASNLRLTVLRSMYLGMEIELAPMVSIAGALTLRRVDRLAGGWEVGDLAAEGATLPTSSAYRPGLGLVVGLSPELLRFKARSR